MFFDPLNMKVILILDFNDIKVIAHNVS